MHKGMRAEHKRGTKPECIFFCKRIEETDLSVSSGVIKTPGYGAFLMPLIVTTYSMVAFDDD